MLCPISVIVVTKNEARRLPACLEALSGFAEVIVVDSVSADKTAQVAEDFGVPLVPFRWNGRYPKKRQWVLDLVPTRSDWIFFVDADEIVTDDLKRELRTLFGRGEVGLADFAGFFVKGRYVVDGVPLRYGLQNNKIAIVHRHRMMFPVVDDLDIPGMGEIEGHYQPVLVPGTSGSKIGALSSPLLHLAYADERGWAFRHEKYARWEVGMNRKQAWPVDPVPWRQRMKVWLRQTSLRPYVMFFYSYVLRMGAFDGVRGRKFAKSRYLYYKRIHDYT